MKICLDYGHRNNQNDYGATNGKIRESELALQIGNKLLTQLNSQHEVILTRDSENKIISLGDRCRIANDNSVGLFISIHINAAENKDANGVEVLHYNGANNKSTAKAVCDAVCKVTGAANRGAKERNDLYVLNSTKMPAILIECGFLSNYKELAQLVDEDYQWKIVEGICVGLGFKFSRPQAIPDNGVYWRVICGSYNNKDLALDEVRRLEAMGLKPFIAKYEK